MIDSIYRQTSSFIKSSNFPYCRRGMGGLPSSRLLKGRGSVAPGEDSLADTDSVDGGNEEVEK